MLNETPAELAGVTSRRAADLAAPLANREFRASYMAHHLRAFLADQIRGLRGEVSQKDFGQLIGKPQSVVSRLEDEDYGKVSLQTLIDISTKLDIALLVRFVDFPTFLQATADFSEKAITPAPYESNAVNEFIEHELEAAQKAASSPASAVHAFDSLPRKQENDRDGARAIGLPKSDSIVDFGSRQREAIAA